MQPDEDLRRLRRKLRVAHHIETSQDELPQATAAAARKWRPGAWSRRRAYVERDLPRWLDLLVVCLDAGLTVEASLREVSSRSTGPLAEEFVAVLNSLAAGGTWRGVLEEMALRLDIPALTKAVHYLAATDQTNVALGGVLRQHAHSLRTKRSQRARELAPALFLFQLSLDSPFRASFAHTSLLIVALLLLYGFWAISTKEILVLLLAASALSFPSLLRRNQRRRHLQVEKELAAALIGVTRALRSGSTLLKAVESASETAWAPVDHHLQVLARSLAEGVPIEDSLRSFGVAVKSPEVDLLVAVAGAKLRVQSCLAELLDGLACALEERVQACEEIEALTASVQFADKALTVAPLWIAAFVCGARLAGFGVAPGSSDAWGQAANWIPGLGEAPAVWAAFALQLLAKAAINRALRPVEVLKP